MNLEVPSYYQEFTSFGSPVSLVIGQFQFARVIKCVGAGTVTCKMTGSRGSQVSLTVVDGETIQGQFTSIDSVSGVTRIRAGF